MGNAGRFSEIEDEVFQLKIQRAMLEAFAREGVFVEAVLQGGCALYFFYRNVRWSEDVDLIKNPQNRVPNDRIVNKLCNALNKVARVLPSLYPEVSNCEFKVQKNTPGLSRILFKVSLKDKKEKIKVRVEVADILAWTNRVEVLNGRIVVVEEPVEILADKVVAIVGRAGTREEFKARDVLDFYHLGYNLRLLEPPDREVTKEKLNDLIKKKLKEYDFTADVIEKGLARIEKWVQSGKAMEELKTSYYKYALQQNVSPAVIDLYCRQVLEYFKNNLNLIRSVKKLFQEVKNEKNENQNEKKKQASRNGLTGGCVKK
jgi:hypothetical protein